MPPQLCYQEYTSFISKTWWMQQKCHRDSKSVCHKWRWFRLHMPIFISVRCSDNIIIAVFTVVLAINNSRCMLSGVYLGMDICHYIIPWQKNNLTLSEYFLFCIRMLRNRCSGISHILWFIFITAIQTSEHALEYLPYECTSAHLPQKVIYH